MDATFTLTVNGKETQIVTDPARPLLEVLREDLGLTGAKYGCGEGRCGACTVLLNGAPVQSCITPVSLADKKTVTTIEGLATGDQLHPVQQAFLEENAMQCGYCTPGMILRAVALLQTKPKPSETEIVEQMNGHICRCGGYPRVVKAIQRAAGR